MTDRIEVTVPPTSSPAELGLDIADVDQRLAAGLSLPSHTYVDDAVFDFELRAIFDRSWMYFAPRENLAQPGSVVTGQIGRVPVIVARADDGELRGFVNACRHRGYTLVPEDKQCSRIQCAYHSWTYGLEGTLVRTPRTDDVGAPKEELGLHRVSVEEWGQGVYVNTDPDAPTMHQAHPQLHEMAAAIELWLEVDDFCWVGRHVHTQAANWKLWYDNGTECYHCPTVHRDSFSSAYDTQQGEAEENFGATYSYRRYSPARSSSGAVAAGGYGSFQSFPGTQYIQQDSLMIMARAVPTGPAGLTFVVDYLAERGAPEDRVDEWIKLWNQTYAEDAEVVEAIQTNLHSGRVTELRYVEGVEDSSRFFHRLVWDAYRRGLNV